MDIEAKEYIQMRRQHIFCVNSDPRFLDVVRSLLQSKNFNVTTTNFVARTFEQIEALQPDVLIVDLSVAEHAGWDLLEDIYQEATTNEIPVIVVAVDERILDLAHEARVRFGGNVFLIKSDDLEELESHIERLIGTA